MSVLVIDSCVLKGHCLEVTYRLAHDHPEVIYAYEALANYSDVSQPNRLSPEANSNDLGFAGYRNDLAMVRLDEADRVVFYKGPPPVAPLVTPTAPRVALGIAVAPSAIHTGIIRTGRPLREWCTFDSPHPTMPTSLVQVRSATFRLRYVRADEAMGVRSKNDGKLFLVRGPFREAKVEFPMPDGCFLEVRSHAFARNW